MNQNNNNNLPTVDLFFRPLKQHHAHQQQSKIGTKNRTITVPIAMPIIAPTLKEV